MQKVEYILWDTSSLYTSSAMLILRNSCTLLVFLVASALSLPQLVARHSTKNWVEDNKEPSNETIWQMWQMFSGRHFFIVRGFTKKFSHHCGRCLEESAPNWRICGQNKKPDIPDQLFQFLRKCPTSWYGYCDIQLQVPGVKSIHCHPRLRLMPRLPFIWNEILGACECLKA